jgi:phosphoribosyl-AMP cyclohydrolase
MVAGFPQTLLVAIWRGPGNEVASGSAAGNNGRVIDSAAEPSSALDPQIAAMLKRDPAGLIPAVIQEQSSGEVLMVGWMDDEALHRTLTTGRTTFFSRSRNDYWVKGETSGNRQWVREVRLDCDGDTLLVKVHQEGPACHTGDRTCFDGRLLSPVGEA